MAIEFMEMWLDIQSYNGYRIGRLLTMANINFKTEISSIDASGEFIHQVHHVICSSPPHSNGIDAI